MTVSAVRLRLRPMSEGPSTLKKRLMPRAHNVVVITENEVCRLEKSDQMMGANSAPPATAAMLSTTLTMPPTYGTSMATAMVPAPNTSVNRRAMSTSVLSDAFLEITFLYTSFANTTAARLTVVLALLDVAEIIPDSTRPMSPAGSTCWQSIM